MRVLFHFVLASVFWQPVALTPQEDTPSTPSNGSVRPKEAGFLIESATGRPPLLLPRDEVLYYRASIDMGLVSANVGRVQQRCRVTPFQQSILLAAPDPQASDLESVTISIRAKGDYSWYSLDSTIESRILPQAWPRVTYRQISEGTEKRRREIMLGLRDGKPHSSYRKDTSTDAPEGTRIWRKPSYREVPAGTVDMLTAVFYARTLIREELDEIAFPMIDKRYVWLLTLRRGEEKRIETKAGTFDVVEAVLEPSIYPGEKIKKEKLKRFEGLFGIHGSIRMWVEKHTGVPIRIEGSMPVGLLTLGIDVVLESFEGTPEGFAPVE